MSAEQERIDGWVNTLTDLGHATRDKSKALVHLASRDLTPRECEDLYHGDDLANRIVSAIPDEALRQGFGIHASDEEYADRAHALEQRARELGLSRAVYDAMIWGRCKGGAALLLLVEGSGDQDEPLIDERVKRVHEIKPVEREELLVSSKYMDPRLPKFGEPEVYSYQPLGSTPVLVHESRLIFFRGAHTSKRAREKNSGWDHSVLQRVYDVLQQANGNWGNVVHMMNDFSQAVFKIGGLIDAIESGKGDTISLRMALMDRVRAVSKALVLDAGDPEHNIPAEEFQVVERGALTGISTILEQTWLRLATAARMPVSILMGQAPAGLNATGAIDLRWWYDTVRTAQEHEVKPRIERIVRLLSFEMFHDEGEYSIVFPSLWQMTPAEEADLRSKIAATDAIYIDKQVVLPEEIALSRWGKGAFSAEMSLDIDARRSLLESGVEEALAGEEKPAQAPETEAPETEAPETEAPETEAPETEAPETEAPETETPETEAPEAEAPAQEKGIKPGTEKDPGAALNGAQVSSLLEIVTQVATKQIPRSTGVAMMLVAFPITREQAEEVMGDVGRTFYAQIPAQESPFSSGPQAGEPPAESSTGDIQSPDE